MGGVPGIQLWTLWIYVVYFPQRIGGCSKLSDPTWWEVNQKWFLTDCVQYLTPQFIVGGVPAMGPYRSIWPHNLLWEVDHDSSYGLLTDWVYYLTSPGGRWTSNGSLQIWVDYLTPQFIVGGVPAMGPYRFIWPHNYCERWTTIPAMVYLQIELTLYNCLYTWEVFQVSSYGH